MLYVSIRKKYKNFVDIEYGMCNSVQPRIPTSRRLYLYILWRVNLQILFGRAYINWHQINIAVYTHYTS